MLLSTHLTHSITTTPRVTYVSLAAPTPNSSPPPHRRRLLAWVVLALSFVPYFLPEESRPAVYMDGKTPKEIHEKQHERRLNRFLGGSIRSTEFGNDLLDQIQ